MIACLALTPAIDRLVEVDRLVHGQVHRPESAVAVAGGKGLNASRAAATLGASVEAVAALGGELGRWVAAQLGDEGVASRIVWVAAETRICTSIADRETGSLTELYERGGALVADEWDTLAARALEPADWLAVCGSLPPGVEADRVPELIEAARAAGARVALDTHGPALAAGLRARPDLVKVNAAEAAEVADTPERLRELSGGAVVVTRGTEGLVAIDREGRRFQAAVDSRGRYPVGSGDATLAGLLTVLDGNGSWEEAIPLAVGAAAANAEVPGAARFAPERARELATYTTVRGQTP